MGVLSIKGTNSNVGIILIQPNQLKGTHTVYKKIEITPGTKE